MLIQLIRHVQNERTLDTSGATQRIRKLADDLFTINSHVTLDLVSTTFAVSDMTESGTLVGHTNKLSSVNPCWERSEERWPLSKASWPALLSSSGWRPLQSKSGFLLRRFALIYQGNSPSNTIRRVSDTLLDLLLSRLGGVRSDLLLSPCNKMTTISIH